MRSRLILAALIVAVAVAAPASPGTKIEPGPQLFVAAGPQLFVDDYLIATQQGLSRVITPPNRHPVPIVDGVRDHNYQPYMSVIRENGRFRLWYSVKAPLVPPGPDPGIGRLALGHTTSVDGIHFAKPAKELAVPAGYQYGASIVRDSSGYLMPYFAKAAHTTADEFKGLGFARSPDGLRWTAVSETPMFSPGELGPERAPGDITSLVRHRGRYLMFVKMNGYGYPGKSRHAPVAGYRRLVGVMTSEDGNTWTLPRRIFAPDDGDSGITEFYGMGGVVERGGLLIGFLRVLRDDLPANTGGSVEGVGYTVLAWSRDGVQWQRDRAPFLKRGEPGSWDRAMAWADAQVGDSARTLIYYGGYRSGHKTNPLVDRQIGVAVLKRDRYVARSGTGMLTTRPFTHRGGRLFVNARVGGSLTATVKVGARTVSVCRSGRVDAVKIRLRCDRPLTPGVARIVFQLRRASLYGFEVSR